MADWEIIHDLKAYLVYKQIKEGGNKKKLCDDLSEDRFFKGYISLSSIQKKIRNFVALSSDDPASGLSGYTKQAESVFNEFKGKSIQEIKSAIVYYENLTDKEKVKEWKKAGFFVGGGAVAGALKGGSMGIAAFGGAVGAPLWLGGAVAGLACYGAYKLISKNKKQPEKNKEKGNEKDTDKARAV